MARLCSCCNQLIDENEHPFVLSYKRPEQYFDVPEHARSQRIRDADDVCVIDDKMFFVRGVLEVPIKDSNKPFEWGPWAMVEERDFRRYLELYREGSGRRERELPFVGWLSNVPFPYPQTKTLEVSIHLQAKGIRPLFRVLSEQHPLGVDQREGISEEKAHHLLADFKALQEAEKIKPVAHALPKVARNEACPCGSGKKYKKCCGA